MIDAGRKDYKIIAVATQDPTYNSYLEADKMPPHLMNMLQRFFHDYKQLEGKAVEVDEFAHSSEAYPIIEKALDSYSQQRRAGFRHEG